MSDSTAARDRAIEVVTAEIEAGGWLIDDLSIPLDARIVDALLARPEVLRALASAPTADVAEAIVEDERQQHDALDDGWRPGHDYLRGYRAATERAAEIARECAAPEGVDAAPQAVHEAAQRRDPAHDRSSCACCCIDCDDDGKIKVEVTIDIDNHRWYTAGGAGPDVAELAEADRAELDAAEHRCTCCNWRITAPGTCAICKGPEEDERAPGDCPHGSAIEES